MAEDLMKADDRRAESGSPQFRKVLEEELIRYFDQLDAMVSELDKDRNNESADERQG